MTHATQQKLIELSNLPKPGKALNAAASFLRKVASGNTDPTKTLVVLSAHMAKLTEAQRAALLAAVDALLPAKTPKEVVDTTPKEVVDDTVAVNAASVNRTI